MNENYLGDGDYTFGRVWPILQGHFPVTLDSGKAHRDVRYGLAGLVSLHPGRAPTRPVAKLEARVLDRTLKHLPSDGSTHWSRRRLAAELSDVPCNAFGASSACGRTG